MVFNDFAKNAYRSASLARREILALQQLRREHGSKNALLHRLKVLLSVDQLTNGTVASAFDEQSTRIGQLEGRSVPADLSPVVASLSLANARVAGELAKLETLRATLADTRRVSAWESYLAAVPFSRTEVVSVIMPTRNRVGELPAAVASVLEQSYARWELVIVDDGSTDGTRDYLRSLSDPRIRTIELEPCGVSAARNAALAAATGEIITYLDDDNVLHPNWLKAVVWGFANHLEANVLYGARVTETPLVGEDKLQLVWEAFDRNKLLSNNFIDMGSIAHRARIDGACFDEELDACVDWDLILRLTEHATPLRLPHVSHFYCTGASPRLSARENPFIASERVRRKHRPPLRVLLYEAMYPLRTETYMTDECDALSARGLELAVARHFPSAGPMPVDIPVYDNLATAIADFKPDALLMHWATHAVQENATLARIGLPYAVRVHSYDAHTALIEQLQSDPQCFGIWAFPQFARNWPGTFSLPAVFPHTDLFAPEAGVQRKGVSVVAASLPKRDWPFLHSVFDKIPQIEKRVVLGTTNEWEHLPFDLVKECTRRGHGAMVQVNMDRRDVASLLKRTSVMLYTLEEAQRNTFGMPQTILEAMFSGASVVLPNWPLVREFAGPSARYYDNADDIIRHILVCEAGGAEVEAERRANRDWAMQLCGSPEHADRFCAQLTEQLFMWRSKHRPAPQRSTWAHAIRD